MEHGIVGGVVLGLLLLLLPMMILSIPIIAIVTYHKRKVLEMKLKAPSKADERLMAEIHALRDQMVDLRDTTTKYDVSFDTALKRLESRVQNLEVRVPYRSDEEQVSASVRTH